MQCPKCGFWKLNEFTNNEFNNIKKCKKCGYVNKLMEDLEKEKKQKGLKNE